MKKEETFNIMGVIVGIIIIVAGCYVILNPAETYSTSPLNSYTFGADFYTEQYAATKTAAGNAAVAANNLRELGGKLALYYGMTFVFSGILVCLSYGKKLACSNEKEKETNDKENSVAMGADAASTLG